MDIIQEELEIFKASANRMRWFISTAVLISVLILLHVYLEKFSFQEAQLQGGIANRLVLQIMDTQKCYLRLIEAKQKGGNSDKDQITLCADLNIPRKEEKDLQSRNLEDLINEYSKRNLMIMITDNTLKEEKLPARQIPILGTEIPANDFVIVMSLMSLVFVIGVWLNLRGLQASLDSLRRHDNPELLRLAHLNTVFLTNLESRSNSFARKVRTCSLWLPFFAIVLATVIGSIQVIGLKLSSGPYYAGSNFNIIVLFTLSFIISALHYMIASACSNVMISIDGAFQSPQDGERIQLPI